MEIVLGSEINHYKYMSRKLLVVVLLPTPILKVKLLFFSSPLYYPFYAN